MGLGTFHTEDRINRDQKPIGDAVWKKTLNERDRCGV